VARTTDTRMCHIEIHKFERTLNFQAGILKAFQNVALFRKTLKKVVMGICEDDRLFVIDCQ